MIHRAHVPRAVAAAVVLALAVTLSGCGGQQIVLDPEETAAALAASGVDEFAQSDFRRIDLLIQQGEEKTARALLENMPASLRESAPWNYRMAVLLARRQDYAAAYRFIQKAKVGAGYPREYCYLAIFLELADGRPTAALSLCLEIVDRFPRDAMAWSYLLDAAARSPAQEGTQGAVNYLARRYPNTAEVRTLMALVLYGRGEATQALEWMKGVLKRRPNDLVVRRLYLDLLRNGMRWQEFGREARAYLEMLPEKSPERAPLEDELKSVLLAARMQRDDPVPGAARMDPSGTTIEEMMRSLPRSVPNNERDSRDGMPPDFLDAEGKPLYFLPFQANQIAQVGVRLDRDVMARSPQMQNPERDNRARHAFDILLPTGTPVMAARGGVVSRVAAAQLSEAGTEFERVIEIAHRDGSVARYWHIERFKALVQPGDSVYRGQIIGASGPTGVSRHQHLRFEVVEPAETDYDWWEPYVSFRTVPVRFADVSEPSGVPVEGRWYRSRNVFVPPVY